MIVVVVIITKNVTSPKARLVEGQEMLVTNGLHGGEKC